jgi:hypothetical protein
MQHHAARLERIRRLLVEIDIQHRQLQAMVEDNRRIQTKLTEHFEEARREHAETPADRPKRTSTAKRKRETRK